MGRKQFSMWKALFAQHQGADTTLQGRVRTMVVRAILDGVLTPGMVLPSSRGLASLLGVSRNTVTLAYQHLVDQSYIEPHDRSCYQVSAKATPVPSAASAPPARALAPDWTRRLARQLSRLANIHKPRNWQDYPFPFIYGQFDSSLFPAREWRECAIQALRATAVRDWACDRIDQDDAQLIEQIQQRVLPARGIWVGRDEVLITAGAQQANYILAEVLFGSSTVLGLEEPGYPDVRNIYSSRGARVRPLPLDAQGMVIGKALAGCDYVYVTPSHQCPTTVTMPESRRRELLEAARRQDFVLIEDDYDSELNFEDRPAPALKSLDREGRVIYVGSLSKTIAPGLRVGYMVADAQLIHEARAARRLMMRHPPTNNERALALFLSLGHHDMLIRRLTKAYDHRLSVLAAALAEQLPDWRFVPPQGGSALWIEGPRGLSMNALTDAALREGVVVEPGNIFFDRPASPQAMRHLRMGVGSIHESAIPEGVARLARAARRLHAG